VQKLLEHIRATERYAGNRPSDRSLDVQALDRANIAFLQADYDTTLREIAAIKQPTAASMQLAGWAQYRLDRIDAAREQFSRLLAQSPDDTEAMSGMAYCALRSGDLGDAEARFGQVLARLPEDAAALEGLGHVKYRQGNPAEARTYFQRALARNPENPETRQMLEKLQSAPVSTAGQAVHTAD
jgi:Flp pilus assembly protein TadD